MIYANIKHLKKVLIIALTCLSFSIFACDRALPTDDPNFCASFKSVAACHCTSSGLPFGMCQDMHKLYARMIVIFKTLEKACEYQHHTTQQDCLDNWHCYLGGGQNSQGELCSSTGRPCE